MFYLVKGVLLSSGEDIVLNLDQLRAFREIDNVDGDGVHTYRIELVYPDMRDDLIFINGESRDKVFKALSMIAINVRTEEFTGLLDRIANDLQHNPSKIKVTKFSLGSKKKSSKKKAAVKKVVKAKAVAKKTAKRAAK